MTPRPIPDRSLADGCGWLIGACMFGGAIIAFVFLVVYWGFL